MSAPATPKHQSSDMAVLESSPCEDDNRGCGPAIEAALASEELLESDTVPQMVVATADSTDKDTRSEIISESNGPDEYRERLAKAVTNASEKFLEGLERLAINDHEKIICSQEIIYRMQSQEVIVRDTPGGSPTATGDSDSDAGTEPTVEKENQENIEERQVLVSMYKLEYCSPREQKPVPLEIDGSVVWLLPI